jgi:hypothetical protein
LFNKLITSKVVSLNPAHGEVCLIKHYEIKFVSNLGLIGGFLWVLWFPPPIKLTAMIVIAEAPIPGAPPVDGEDSQDRVPQPYLSPIVDLTGSDKLFGFMK